MCKPFSWIRAATRRTTSRAADTLARLVRRKQSDIPNCGPSENPELATVRVCDSISLDDAGSNCDSLVYSDAPRVKHRPGILAEQLVKEVSQLTEEADYEQELLSEVSKMQMLICSMQYQIQAETTRCAELEQTTSVWKKCCSQLQSMDGPSIRDYIDARKKSGMSWEEFRALKDKSEGNEFSDSAMIAWRKKLDAEREARLNKDKVGKSGDKERRHRSKHRCRDKEASPSSHRHRHRDRDRGRSRSRSNSRDRKGRRKSRSRSPEPRRHDRGDSAERRGSRHGRKGSDGRSKRESTDGASCASAGVCVQQRGRAGIKGQDTTTRDTTAPACTGRYLHLGARRGWRRSDNRRRAEQSRAEAGKAGAPGVSRSGGSTHGLGVAYLTWPGLGWSRPARSGVISGGEIS
ncbi:hypothetical protein GGI07_005663 [Coemansia sp. Benny D115]|nr:hypothetical protein GGI07_005663 [Coemansia sp. Benny D115]